MKITKPRQITFVCDDQPLNVVLVRVGVDVLQPEVRDVVERLLVGDVINDDDPVGSLIVGGRFGGRPFTRCA